METEFQSPNRRGVILTVVVLRVSA